VNAAFVSGGILAVGELAVTAQPTPNMTVAVGPGRAKIVGSSASAPSGMTWTTQSMYDVLNDASANVTISSADATNPRIDLVYIQVQDAFYTGSNNQAVLAVAAGTPAASPAVPATPVNAIALAQIAVAANATSITNANITSLTSKATLLGQVIVYQTLAARNAATGMKLNDLCAVVADGTATNNAFYYYTGSAWAAVTSTAGFMPTGGSQYNTLVKNSGTNYDASWGTLPVQGGGTGATSFTANSFVISGSTSVSPLTTQAAIQLSTSGSNVTGTLPVGNGGTGVNTMTAGILKYVSGTSITSGNKIDVTSDIPITEQAKISAGALYSGGDSTKTSFNIFVQSTQPSTGLTLGDLWFWG
jgi:hypothetical protein